MSTIVVPMASPNSLKRRYEDAGLDESPHKNREFHATTAEFAASKHLSPSQKQGSFSVFPEAAHHEPPPLRPATQETAMHPLPESATPVIEKANKRPKLTFAEKEARRIEKEFKDKQRAEELAKREEEKLQREKEKAEREKERLAKVEERRLKEEERKKAKDEKDRLREGEKAKKEEERQKKEEEKSKKARVCDIYSIIMLYLWKAHLSQSQLRLNAFFGQPSLTRSSTASPSREASAPLGSSQNSSAEIDAVEIRQHRSRSTSLTPRKPQIPEFERAFPPFFLQSHTSLAPPHRFARDEEGLEWITKTIDTIISKRGEGPEASTAPTFAQLLHIRPKHSTSSEPRFRVKDIVSRMDGDCKRPIDLTDSVQAPSRKPEEMLKEVPMKFLKFREDVRPPYIGTCSRFSHTSIPKMARKPCEPNLPGVDYDYDSEAEWEEPEEGEDLDSEGEEEAEDEDEDEMEGFLDDEDNGDGKMIKRRPLLGDQEPACSGICWAGESTTDHSAYKIDMLLGT